MTIALDHTVLAVRDKEAAARWFATIFGVTYDGPAGPFASVKVNTTLTLDFDDRRPDHESQHFAFSMTNAEFDAILDRVKAAGIPFGGDPRSSTDGNIGTWGGCRRVYFADPDAYFSMAT
jgi:catechol 2,3-dioxygenase-like lactoylglutathione lyase family enzyme